jgi:hypothetical protein
MDSVLLSGPITSPNEFATRLSEIQAALGSGDGLAYFNHMYTLVTASVSESLDASAFTDPEWITTLDVAFANLYLDALRNSVQAPDAVPRAWAALLERRNDPRITPLQFALAGMNAHINHDLVFAIIRTCQELDLEPRDGTPHHEDFTKVNVVLGDVEDSIKSAYDQGCIGDIDRRMGRIDDMFVMWNVGAAREMAWDWAGLLWPLRDDPELFTKADRLIGRMVGFAGRGMTTLRLG